MNGNGELSGPARLGRRTKDLVKRLRPEDVAIVDHADLDRVSAEELAESGVRVVVNVAPSSTGRFPNAGPLELVRAGVRLVDAPGAALFDELSDGELVRVERGHVWRDGTLLAEGTELDATTLEAALAEQQGRLSQALEAFAENTLLHLRDEAESLAAGFELPALRTRFRDRHVLVVARGPGYKSDLRMVRPYIRDFHPVIVAVGTHFNLVEFLERNRAGMSSTFVTRLKVGEILVDAKGVSRLVSSRTGVWPITVLVLAALAALVVAVLASPALRNVVGLG